MARKYDLISELYNRTCKTVVSSPESWQAFLTSACRNYKLRFDEQLLVFAQRPDATAVLEIERWQKGYTATTFKDGSREENAAVKDKFNEKLGVTKAQEQAMIAGSMFGWDKPAAKPKNYDENGKPIKPKNKDYER